MNSSQLKPLLSLGNKLIGFILFVICAIAIYNKVLQNENLHQYGADLKIQLAKIHWSAWLLMGGLLTLNYTIEAIKWKSVIASTNRFTTLQALRAVLNVKEKPKHYDATDALAVALCHWHQINRPLMMHGKGLKGWGDFIQKNPARLKK